MLFAVYADEWTQRAQRGERFEATLLSLRELLLQWRREQVRTFGRTLEHIHKNSHVDTILAAKGILQFVFDKLMDSVSAIEEFCGIDLQNSPEQEHRSSLLLAMCVEWMRYASLLDFESRLCVLKLCVRILRYSNNCSSLIDRLRALCEYYTVCFVQRIRERSNTLTAGVKKELEVRLW